MRFAGSLRRCGNVLKLLQRYKRTAKNCSNRFGSEDRQIVFDLRCKDILSKKVLKENNQSDLIPEMEYYLVVLNGDYCFDGTSKTANRYTVWILTESFVMIIDLSGVTKKNAGKG